MRILVVSKTTNLDRFGENVRKHISAGLLARDNLAKLESAHRDHYQTKSELLTALDQAGIETVEVDRGRFWPSLDNFDLVVTVGGDGTVLEASHHIADGKVPLVGLRSSVSSVGYLCLGGPEAIDPLVAQLTGGRLPSLGQPVCRLTASVLHMRTEVRVDTDPVLNDFLYTNINPSATTRYRISMVDVVEEQKSSGLWISTAAGSTAAISAAGGQRLGIDDRRFQYWVRELYRAPQANTAKYNGGFFDPEKSELAVENLCDQALLALDGQHGSIGLEYGDVIRFRRGPDLNLIRRFI